MPTKYKPARGVLGDAVLAVAIAEPLMTVPQIYQIWSTHVTAGVSLISWLGYIIAAFVWLAYSLKIRDKPLIISSTMWVIAEGLVILGVLQSRGL